MEGWEGSQGCEVRALLAAAPCDSDGVEVIMKEGLGEKTLSQSWAREAAEGKLWS